MQQSPIGIFDSGVGGLTILSEIQKLLPQESFIYVADQRHAPYGEKTKLEIQKRALTISHFLLKKNVKLIVIACNTSTIASINTLRRRFKIPIIGVVPVVKRAAETTNTKKIAVFATPSTIRSAYLQKLIKNFAPNAEVLRDGATGLEKLIEMSDLKDEKIQHTLVKHLLPLKEKGVDVIALGCTHYPFVKKQIQKIVGKNILVLDSGGAVARQTKRILEAENALAEKKGKDWYYTTGNKEDFDIVVKKLTGKKISTEQIHI